MAPPRARVSPHSRGLQLREVICNLLDDQRTKDAALKSVDVKKIVTTMDSNIRTPVIYVQLLQKPISHPTTLGRRRVNYKEVWVVRIVYIHSRIEKDATDELVLAMDVLSEFFERNSGLNGFANMGLQIFDNEITTFLDGRHMYNAVKMDMYIAAARKRDRGQT